MSAKLEPYVTSLTLTVHIHYPVHDLPPPAPPGYHWDLAGTHWQPVVTPSAGVSYIVHDYGGMLPLVFQATFSGPGSWAFTGINIQAWQLCLDTGICNEPSWWDTKRSTVDVTINAPDSGLPPWECEGEGWCSCAEQDSGS